MKRLWDGIARKLTWSARVWESGNRVPVGLLKANESLKATNQIGHHNLPRTAEAAQLAAAISEAFHQLGRFQLRTLLHLDRRGATPRRGFHRRPNILLPLE